MSGLYRVATGPVKLAGAALSGSKGTHLIPVIDTRISPRILRTATLAGNDEI